MLGSILASGLAVGAVYALVGVTYNVMFATSRVMSFTAGQLGLLGGGVGSPFLLPPRTPPPPGPRLALHPAPRHAARARLRADARRLRADRGDHRARGGAAGAEEPRPAPLRA